MFIHWGIYSQAAGYWQGKSIPGGGEWIMDEAHLTRKAYSTLAAKFDPIDFNADRWVRMARRAGVKYIVITSKHHDGFCMFRTRATHFNVVDDTPWHKDPLAMLAKACKKYGIRFCTYYSIQDWHSRYTLPAIGNPNQGHPTWQPMRFTANGGGEKYVHYVQRQVGELIRQYHPSLLWFDNNITRSWITQQGVHVAGWSYVDAADVFHFVRKLDPTIIINNRLGYGFGDYKTPEEHIPPDGLPGAWETCMTINWTWGYKRDDHHWKTPTVLITNLIKCASGGGNFLLNVGPTGKGIIPQSEVRRMLHIMHVLFTAAISGKPHGLPRWMPLIRIADSRQRVAAMPVLNRIVGAKADAVFIAGFRQHGQRVLVPWGVVDHIEVRGIGAKHAKSIMMLRGDDNISGTGPLGHADPPVGIEIDGVELCRQCAIGLPGKMGLVHNPCAVAVRHRLAVPKTGRFAIDTPVDKHAKASLFPPAHGSSVVPVPGTGPIGHSQIEQR